MTLSQEETQTSESGQIPALTLSIIFLNVILYLWDRNWHLTGTNQVFGDLVMRPREVREALTLTGADRFPLVTVFTSMFMHASLAHIFGNMLFLWTFGPGIERAFGSARFTLYYLAWGIFATVTQIYVDPTSLSPTLGASGAIGGVLGAYFILFPSNKLNIVVPFLLFAEFEVAAWILLGLWFVYQIAIPQEGVATWAHAGGFLAGMATVMIAGGPKSVLGGRPLDEF